ncbi:MAG: AraC family transcriptional regulator [Sphingobium sp.]
MNRIVECLSEFLNLLKIERQWWQQVHVAQDAGLAVDADRATMLYAVLDGSLRLHGSGASDPVTLGKGDFAIILPGQAHRIVAGAGAGRTFAARMPSDDEGAHYPPCMTTVGDGEPAARLLCGRLHVRWPGGMNSPILPSIMLLPADRSPIAVESLGDAARSPHAEPIFGHTASLAIISAMRDQPTCHGMVHNADQTARVVSAVQLMEIHPSQDWTINSLALKMGMSRSTFAARFREEVGKTPMEVLTEVRMTTAVRMLTDSRLKIAAIAERVGYRSEAAFNRRFTARFKVTPGQLRQQKARMASPPPQRA